MKRHGYLFADIVSMDALEEASREASRGKSHYKEVKAFRKNKKELLQKLQQSLIDKTYTTSIYCIYPKQDRGKKRIVSVLPFYPDRIVHHALMKVVAPIIESRFIRDTFQSIPKRGNVDCKRRIERFTMVKDNPEGLPDSELYPLGCHPNKLYCMQADIEQYYPSIKPEILKSQIRRLIKCPDTLWLLDDILDSSDEMPIGNYPSQHLGNYHVTDLDLHMKHDVGCKAYFRYCDDIVILHPSKEFLWGALKEIQSQLALIGLRVKGNYQIYPITSRGIDFVGYVFYPGQTRLRKSIKKSFIRRGKKRSSIMSYYGWLKHCSAKQLWLKYGEPRLRTVHV